MKTQSLTFISKNSHLGRVESKEQKAKLWKESGMQSFSWDNEDYRQSVVNKDIEDAIPKEEDFLPFPFRHLSATIVGGGSWKATEFPEKVLKPSASKLSYKPVYVNHNLETGNVVAGIGKTKWSAAFKAKDGTEVPGGIDGPIWVDGKLHADICRKLSAFPVPHIQSVSVTVVFEWEPSHVFENRDGSEDLWLFESRIGQMVDGEMVRRVATKIIEYYETSFVWLGADPFAKIHDADGELVNIEESAIVGMEKFDKDPLSELYKKTGRFFIEENCISNENKLDLVVQMNKISEENGTINKIETNLNNPKINKKMDEILKYLAQRLGKKPEEITEDFLKTLSLSPQIDIDKLTTIQKAVGTIDEYNILVSERDKLVTDLQGERDAIVASKPMVDFAKANLDGAKEKVLKFYRLSLNEKEEDKAAIALIDRAYEENDFSTLETLAKQYGGTTISELEATCTGCGSTDITFRTTEETDGNTDSEDFESPDLVSEFRKV